MKLISLIDGYGYKIEIEEYLHVYQIFRFLPT